MRVDGWGGGFFFTSEANASNNLLKLFFINFSFLIPTEGRQFFIFNEVRPIFVL